MRTTPKYFLILAAMAGAAVVSASCASDGPSTAPDAQTRSSRVAQDKLKDAHDKFDWIGKYHTDGLAYIYSQLAKGSGKPRSKQETCRIIAKATKEFHKAQRHTDVPAAFADPALVNEVCPSDDGAKPSTTVLVSGQTRKTDLSAGAVNLIDQITYVTATATSRSVLLSGVLDIESQAASLSPDDLGAVVAVGSVALSSMDYWEANLSSWGTLPGMATAYSLSPVDVTAATVGSMTTPLQGPRFFTGRAPGWWQNPFVSGFKKVLIADALAAARVIYSTWYMGPIGWDAAASAALFSSATTAFALFI